MLYENVFKMVGNTPILNLNDEELKNINLYIKIGRF